MDNAYLTTTHKTNVCFNLNSNRILYQYTVLTQIIQCLVARYYQYLNVIIVSLKSTMFRSNIWNNSKTMPFLVKTAYIGIHQYELLSVFR